MRCTLALLRSVSRAPKGILRRVLRPGTPWGFAKYGLPYDLSEEASVCHCSFRDSNLRSRKPPSLRGGEVWAGLDSNQRRRKASRFTVCPVWPLRYLPVMKSFAVRRSPYVAIPSSEQPGQRISRAVYIGLRPADCKRFLGAFLEPKPQSKNPESDVHIARHFDLNRSNAVGDVTVSRAEIIF
jgi:hypothetical protein